MAQPLTAPNDPPVLAPRSDRVRLALEIAGANLWPARLTFGEGWHNNHHFCPGLGRVYALKPVPTHVMAKKRA
jgi:hypothetical protein